MLIFKARKEKTFITFVFQRLQLPNSCGSQCFVSSLNINFIGFFSLMVRKDTLIVLLLFPVSFEANVSLEMQDIMDNVTITSYSDSVTVLLL